MVYELVEHEDFMPYNLNKNLKFHNLEKSKFQYYWATVIGSNQRMYGYFKVVDMDFKTALKINICIPENEKSLQWD